MPYNFMSASAAASVSALLTCSLKKRSQGVEAVAVGARKDQWLMKESRRILVNLEVSQILWRSMEEISQVGLSPGRRRLSVVSMAAMSVSRVAVRNCWDG